MITLFFLLTKVIFTFMMRLALIVELLPQYDSVGHKRFFVFAYVSDCYYLFCEKRHHRAVFGLSIAGSALV